MKVGEKLREAVVGAKVFDRLAECRHPIEARELCNGATVEGLDNPALNVPARC